MPAKPQEQGGWWAFFLGDMHIANESFLDPHGIDFKWAYASKKPLPENPRVVVHMHGSGAGHGSMMPFGPSPSGDLEVRVQDAETYSQYWREWWMFGADGQPYPGRRIAAALDFVGNRYAIDFSRRGIVLEGPSMGGAGAVVQTMILPDPWRARIAYSSGRAGIVMPRRVAQRSPGQYDTLPQDSGSGRALWDSVDFAIQAAQDPVVRGIHYRHAFSSDDIFSEGPDGSTQTEFVNLVEQNKIAGAFVWVRAGHGTYEPGVKLPDMANFQDKNQDVSLDRAHPAITGSSGNYPRLPAQRVDEETFPRGHYNLGITWNHAAIVDTGSEIVFPLKYLRRTGIGKGVPDQPQRITVNVTPRRPRNFAIEDGATLNWSWNEGELTGRAVVRGDVLTIKGIPLVSGEPYKNLRIYR